MAEERVIIELHSQHEALMLADVVGSLYRNVFSLPPFLGNDDEFRDQRSYYTRVITNPGFQLVTARYAHEHIGFAYGYLLTPETTWWQGVSTALPESFTEETGSRTFALIDFGLLPKYRGIGVGKEIHDAILAASGADRGTLTVQAKAVETRSIYNHLGWRHVGKRSGRLGGVPVAFALYVIDIKSYPEIPN